MVKCCGGLATYSLSSEWSLFLTVNAVNSRDKNFNNYTGFGVGVAPLLVYTPSDWWAGAYVQFGLITRASSTMI
jgi:hypothetical protein